MVNRPKRVDASQADHRFSVERVRRAISGPGYDVGRFRRVPIETIKQLLPYTSKARYKTIQAPECLIQDPNGDC
jgi:hypothetical protein